MIEGILALHISNDMVPDFEKLSNRNSENTDALMKKDENWR